MVYMHVLLCNFASQNLWMTPNNKCYIIIIVIIIIIIIIIITKYLNKWQL